jgi:hypothetical protein
MIGDYSTSFDWSRNGNAFASTRGYPNLAVFLAPNGTLSPLINPFGPQSAAATALSVACPNSDLSAPACGYTAQTPQNTGGIVTDGFEPGESARHSVAIPAVSRLGE